MNPFLQHGQFEWHKYKPKYVHDAIVQLIDEAQQRLAKISELSLPTFEAVILGIERATMPLDRAWGIVCHLDSVCNNDEMRKAKNEVLPLITDFYASIRIDDGLWEQVKYLYESETSKQLDKLEARMLKEWYESFYDNGAQLSTENKEVYKNLSRELSRLSEKFSENVLDSENAFELYFDDATALAGVPVSILQAMQADAAEHGNSGKYRASLTYSVYGPLMKYLEDAGLRERLYRAKEAVARNGDHDNSGILRDILRLRAEKAHLLGFTTYSDFALKERMAKDGITAMRFVDDLFARTRKYFETEQTELAAECERILGHPRFNPWDVSYLMERIRRDRYAFDSDALRRYFSVDGVISGLFDLTEELYGVKFERLETFYSDDETAQAPHGSQPVWHPDVKYYRISDEDGSTIGHFYTDWHPRSSKRSGAWQNSLEEGGIAEDGSTYLPIALVVGSLTSSTPDRPSLLTHDEVETVFHEFGHLLHALFGKVKYESMNGCNVAWDFVELPSQFNENFVWNRESLSRFARDYESGAVLDDETLNRLLRSRTYMAAWFEVRQLSLAKLDLDLHVNYDAKYRDCADVEAVLFSALDGYQPDYVEQPHLIINSFGHIFSGGYASSYYSYKWAEVLEADVFSLFKQDGVISRRIGSEFRAKILSKGDSKDANELFRDFMGRDPDPEALERRNGFTDK